MNMADKDNKFVYRIKDGVQVDEDGIHVMGHGVLKKGKTLESDEPIFSENLELVSAPKKTEKNVGVVPVTEARE